MGSTCKRSSAVRGLPHDQHGTREGFEDIFGVVNDEWVNKFYKFLDSLQLKPSLVPEDIFGR